MSSYPDPASPEGQRWALARFPVDASGDPLIPPEPEIPPREAEPEPEGLHDVLRELITYGARPSRKAALIAAVDADQAPASAAITGGGAHEYPVFGGPS